jgi:glucose/arabinose dehydrogenase
VVNERDELGSDLVPDYLTSVRDGGFYGWPYSYYGQHVDTAVSRRARTWWPRHRARLRAGQPHTASLGLASPAAARCRRRSPRHVHRPARLVEPQAAQRLQGDLRALRRRPARGHARRRADRLPQRDGKAWGRPVGVAIDGAARCWWPTTWAT